MASELNVQPANEVRIKMYILLFIVVIDFLINVWKNCWQVYSDLEVAFVISEEEAIFKALSKTMELLQGNTAPISQNYYGCLFNELLAFQLPDRHPFPEVSYLNCYNIINMLLDLLDKK